MAAAIRRERTDIDVEAGQMLRAARLRAKVTTSTAAAAASVSEDMIFRYERGGSWPTYSTLARLAGCYRIAVGDFFPNSAVAPESEVVAPIFSAMAGMHLDQQTELISYLAAQVRMIRGWQRVSERATPTTPVNSNVVSMPDRTLPVSTPEFPVDPAQFNFEHSDTDYPLFLHGYEMEDFEAAAGVTGFENEDMGTTVLNSKEVRDESIRIVKVRGDSMSPTFESGWKIAVDVTNTKPENGEVVLVQRENGTLLGRWHRVAGETLLAKDNEDHQPVELTSDDRVVGVVSHVAWQPIKRAAMPARMPKTPGRKR